MPDPIDQIPDPERAIELFDMAVRRGEKEVTYIGWASDGILYSAARRPRYRSMQFEVAPSPDRSHEDEVLIFAVRVPHPDSMSMDELLLGPDHELLRAVTLLKAIEEEEPMSPQRSSTPRWGTAFECDHFRQVARQRNTDEWHHVDGGVIGDRCTSGPYEVHIKITGEHTLDKLVFNRTSDG